MKAIIISAPIGSGHIRAGQAVGAALQSIDPKADIGYINVFDFFPSYIGQSILRAYLKILALFPQAYGMAYSWGNTSRLALFGRKLVSRVLARQMRTFLQAQRPDVIVCTHATPAGLAAELSGRGELTIPVVAVVTDFVVHRLWMYPEITHYCVASQALREQLAVHGISPQRSTASGIPVTAGFVAAHAASRTRESFPGGAMPTVMIMGGGAGLLPIPEIVNSLDILTEKIRIIAVCGSNRKLEACLSQMQKTSKHCLHVYGFVNNIAELMAAADLLITKPGGLTAAEAMCCGLPMLLYRPIPGQEMENSKYLIAQGSALPVNAITELGVLVDKLLCEKEQLRQMRQNALVMGRPDAAERAARLIRRFAGAD